MLVRSRKNCFPTIAITIYIEGADFCLKNKKKR
jgi:hypothetical protein